MWGGLWTLSTSGISCRTSGKAKAHLLQKASPLSFSLTPTLKGGYWPPWTRVSLRLLCPPLITLFPALLHPSEGRLQRETLPEACPTCVSWVLIFLSTFWVGSHVCLCSRGGGGVLCQRKLCFKGTLRNKQKVWKL